MPVPSSLSVLKNIECAVSKDLAVLAGRVIDIQQHRALRYGARGCRRRSSCCPIGVCAAQGQGAGAKFGHAAVEGTASAVLQDDANAHGVAAGVEGGAARST